MSVHSSRYPLIRISKTGEMRLKNKVSTAILKENTHEERALATQLAVLNKHRDRQGKYLTYRQLDFANKQITASEDRPRTIATTDGRRESYLPPINAAGLDESVRRQRANTVSDTEDASKAITGEGGYATRSKSNWEKAITFVKLAVQNRPQQSEEENKTFVTQQVTSKKRKGRKASPKNPETSTSLPPLTMSQEEPIERRRKRKHLSKQLSFPEMLKVSREMSKVGLEDPRFVQLTSCLSREGGVRNSTSTVTSKPKLTGKRKISQSY
ncbi:predicted protein [Nematostella vectensis]|uniref:Uncharacterized protein n=1 Tax=Nematostella vectensis TaxID=45351 RepID=A7RU42_NEMVE|nr:predicted protein [Nematostella vectensis]|eukprot:XP_001637082.1 predicted protein [Nematostella vectensis]